jgi:hypothetical protein
VAEVVKVRGDPGHALILRVYCEVRAAS